MKKPCEWGIKLLIAVGVATLGCCPVANAQNIFTCDSFTSSGACGVSLIGGSGQAFAFVGSGNGAFPGLPNSQADLIPVDVTHGAYALNYQTPVNIQAFTSTFTFTPNGQNVAFVIQNNTNKNAGPAGPSFFSGAGCEAGFYQGFGPSPSYPNNIFALELDSWSYLGSVQQFTYSSAMIYQADQSPCNPNNSAPNYVLIDKVSTSPVPLDSPANAQGTSTGDTYSATVTYDGANVALHLYDVTAGGSCPGASCFSYTWSGVNMPSLVGGNTAYVGLTAGVGETSRYPLYVDSFSYTSGDPPPPPTVATPTFSVPAGTYTSTQMVTISDTTSGATIYYSTNGIAPTTSSTQYIGPISVSSTETLEAIAVATGDTNSAVASAAYTINTMGVGSPMTCLPLQSVPGQPATLQTVCTITLAQ